MSKLIMLSGLPASGKSTRAKEIVAQGNWIRVNRDLLRKMLHSDAKWTGRKEDITVKMEREIAKKALADDINVVVDDCNLNPSNKEMWSQLAREADASFTHEHIDTSPGECIQRDRARETSVGMHVIVNMALQYQKYPKQALPFVICDLDGTLANIDHRLKIVKVPEGEKKDWDAFFKSIPNDEVRWEVADKLKMYLHKGHPLIFVSGRPERCRKDTEQWLVDKVFSDPRWMGYDTHCALIMRQDHDKRDDDLVKRDIYEKFLKHYPLEVVIDDRPRVIRMWQAVGLPVIDVGSGVEF